METVSLKDIVSYRKNFITIDDDKIYKRCRVQLHRRGVKLRDEIKGYNIKTKKQRLCKANDFIVAEMDAKFGGYGIIPRELDGAIVSSHYYLYEFKMEKINPDFFDAIIDSGLLQEQIKAVGSTNYSRVSAKEVLDYTIPCPSLMVQETIVSLYCSCRRYGQELSSELTHQQTLLKKLRQQILQEAIEGKLTAEWRQQNPDVEPASELLARIQAEKAQLIKDKKIKRQKPLPPISEEEKPFALPEGWVWCRFGDVLESTFYGPRFGKGEYVTDGIPTIRTTDMSDGIISFKNPPMVNVVDPQKIELYKLHYDDLLVTRTGSIGTMVLYKSNDLAFPSAYLIRCRFLSVEMADFLFNYLLTPMIQDYLGLNTKTGTRPNINAVSISNALLPLPPLQEQEVIVAKVEKLLALCDELETQITTNQTHAEQLMQAVLREAFSHSPDQQNQKTV